MQTSWVSCIDCQDKTLKIIPFSDKNRNRSLVDHAYQQLEDFVISSNSENGTNSSIPVYCFEGLNVYIESINSIYADGLPASIQQQLSSLKLSNPFQAKYINRKKEETDISILDINKERILIIGGATYITERINKWLSMFSTETTMPSNILEHVEKLIRKNSEDPIDAGSVMAGLSAIFLFSFGLFVSKIISAGLLSGENAFLLFSFGSSILLFFTFKFVGVKIVIISNSWTANSQFASMFTFLLLLICISISLVGSVDLNLTIYLSAIASMILMCSMMITIFGQTFRYSTGKTPFLLFLFFLLVVTYLFL